MQSLIGFAGIVVLSLLITAPWWIRKGVRSIPGYAVKGFFAVMGIALLAMAASAVLNGQSSISQAALIVGGTLLGTAMMVILGRALLRGLQSSASVPSNAMRFRNPSNGYTETTSNPGLWALLFGSFYFAFKGIWVHAAASLVLAVMTAGVSWLVYPFFAARFIRQHYLRSGWIELA